jgi:GNAT superfamily N-acetyltransferase
LVNRHLGVVIPGWSLPEAYFASSLLHNPFQYVVDPWVIKRQTWCALLQQRVVAAAHLLGYGNGPEVGETYKGVGDIAWLVAWPGHQEAAAALLAAVREQMAQWGIREEWAFDNGLPITLVGGIPEAWPHIMELFTKAGYTPKSNWQEHIYGGSLTGIPLPGAAPVAGLTIQRRMLGGAGFVALFAGEEVGYCDWLADLTEGGKLPSLRGWAELEEIDVEEQWRNQGIGSWLVQHGAAWCRLAGCERVALNVTKWDEEHGAGRFYDRIGWQPFTRLHKGWQIIKT